jgi:hypothetical protein
MLKGLGNELNAYIEYGAVVWPVEIDLAPDAMYDRDQDTGREVPPLNWPKDGREGSGLRFFGQELQEVPPVSSVCHKLF